MIIDANVVAIVDIIVIVVAVVVVVVVVKCVPNYTVVVGVNLTGVVVVVVDDSLSIILRHDLGCLSVLSSSGIGSSNSHLSSFPTTKKTYDHSKDDNSNDAGLGGSDIDVVPFGGSWYK